MNCRACRSYLESRSGLAEVAETATPRAEISSHLAACAACQEYARLCRWSRGVVQAGAVAAPEPPAMAAVWAAVRRQSGSSWGGASWEGWRHSFVRLVPYLASITVLFLLAGSLALGGALRGAPPAAASNPSIPSLLAPSATVATSMPVDVAVQSPTDWLGVGAP